MMHDFFINALLAGIGLALLTGPLGCILVWRRLSFFSDTLSHASLLGVALSLYAGMPITLAVILVVGSVALGIVWLIDRKLYASDHILGLLSHSALALGLVTLGFISQPIDLTSLLFGDILAVSTIDLAVIYLGGIAVLGVLIVIWSRLLAGSVHRELAQAEGMHPMVTNIVLVLLIALVVAMAIKIIGVLLIAALLLLPAATARRLANTPEGMAVVAAGCGLVAVITGLFASLNWDSPSGPSIVVAALLLFVVVNLPFRQLKALFN